MHQSPALVVATPREERLEDMGIISWIIVGLIAGALGRLVMPGDEPGGFMATLLIGMAGAVVGGFVVGILGGTGATGLNIWSILVATLGAIILLALYRLIAERSRVT
jgi:uncharacterized membrane protein YeaQ/YmgE (transglycosylase-associated protein family)